MSLLIRAGVVVPAVDGTSIENGAVVVEDTRIVDVLDARAAEAAVSAFTGTIIDQPDSVLMPGLVNIHTHGVSPSPLFPSGSAALAEERWRAHLDRHLAAGTTTVLSTCGLGDMADVLYADQSHAVHVRAATAHTSGALEAARAADGAGLTARHRILTIEAMFEAGAVAIGELGGGQTLGGGGQDLVFLPAAIRARTGCVVTQAQARALKEAVLGRFMSERRYKPEALAVVAREAGVAGLSTEELRELIVATVMPSVGHARDGIREGVEAARAMGVPALVHSASASADVIRSLQTQPDSRRATIIAGHVNHTSHTVQEAVALAELGLEAGWYAEASVFDLLEGRETVQTREHWDALMQVPGLVDVVATDYGHDGRHDSLMSAVRDLVHTGHRTLVQAVQMVTSVPAALIPGLVEGSAMLRRGAPADLVLTARADLRDIREVFVGGESVVQPDRLGTKAAS